MSFQDQKHGWLTNQQRKEIRDTQFSLTDDEINDLIKKVESIPDYISPKLEPKILDHLMRLRDKAMIALNWMWFKRANEILSLKRENITVKNQELLVTFTIQKKKKRLKFCPLCNEKNGYKSKFCKNCSQNLTETQITEEGTKKIVTKHKTLNHSFASYIIDWLQEYDKLTSDKKILVLSFFKGCFQFSLF